MSLSTRAVDQDLIRRIESVSQFVVDKIEFFAAPFLDQVKFQEWEKTSDEGRYSLVRLHRVMAQEYGLKNDEFESLKCYKTTIVDTFESKSVDEYGCISCNPAYLHEYLLANPKIIELFERIRRNYHLIVSLWYRENYIYTVEYKVEWVLLKSNEYAESLIKLINSNPNSQAQSVLLANQKLQIVKEAVAKLNNLKVKNKRDRLQHYCDHLEANIATLGQRRDGSLMTFAKGLAFVGLMVLSVFMGAYCAYSNLFGSRATNGLRLAEDAKEKLETISAVIKQYS